MINSEIKPKFFGRRQGRTIHKTKNFLLENFLPRLKIDGNKSIDINKIFSTPKERYCLEIGFGDGEHLAALAKDMPSTGFVGIEVYKNGVANLLNILTGIREGSECPADGAVDFADGRVDNIRVFDDDARLLFDHLPDAVFDKIYLLFPDPWPKKKHAARRFVNPDNLNQLSRLLKKGGILQIATDHQVYKRWVMEQMRQRPDFVWTAKCSDDWRNPPADWHETKYQRKAIREGRRPVFFEYRKLV